MVLWQLLVYIATHTSHLFLTDSFVIALCGDLTLVREVVAHLTGDRNGIELYDLIFLMITIHFKMHQNIIGKVLWELYE